MHVHCQDRFVRVEKRRAAEDEEALRRVEAQMLELRAEIATSLGTDGRDDEGAAPMG